MSIGQWLNVKLVRFFNYEYWPFAVFYIPMYFYGIYLAIRARSFTYFSTSNLNMKYGGIIGESKYKILQMIPKEYVPSTLFIKHDQNPALIAENLSGGGIHFPVIVKPDVGERGKKVEKIDDLDSLLNYQKQIGVDFLIQDFIDLPMEAGVLFYRFPDQENGVVSSIVLKGFLTLKGNGINTFEELLKKEIRAYSRQEYLKKKYSNIYHKVVDKREEILLEPIGNHCRGTTFINGNHLINNGITELFTKISSRIPGFYYGRFDVKINDVNDLITGDHLKIMELNGISSEPGHIYDPNYRILSAYKDLAFHMRVICQISKINHQKGIKRAPLMQVVKEIYARLREK